MQLLKKIKSYQFIIFLLIGVSSVSCKSNYALLTIENARPAKDELPANIQSLTLMNRSMNSQFANHREDSLQLYFYRKNYQLSSVVLDSTAADTTIRALAELLFESGRYDAVVPLERNINRSLPFEMIPDTLTSEYVNKICDDYQTDALMVLERFSTKVMTDYSKGRLSYESQSYYATLDLKYHAFFRVYKPGKDLVVKEIAITDTIYWESADYTQEKLFGRLPSIKQALINAGIKVALDIDGKLSPTWVPEKRGYFLINPKNDRGQLWMTQRNYKEAEKYWTEMAQSSNKKKRSKAEYNLALISELNGDIDLAMKWGIKSYYSHYRHQTEAYLKKLKAKKETP